MKQSTGILLLVLTAAIWGLSFVAQTVSSSHVGPFTFNATRFLIGAITLLPFFLRRRRVVKEWKHTIVGGICCALVLTAASALQQKGMETTPTGKAGFITSLYMLIVPFLSLFLGRKISLRHWLCVGLALLGMYLLCGTTEGGFSSGEALVLASAFLFAIHILVIEHFSDTDGVVLSSLQFCFAGLLCLVVMPAERPLLSEMREIALPLLYAGVMSCGVAYTLQVIGQKAVEASLAVLPLSLESVFSAIFGFLILRQKLTVTETLGCLVVFAAVILCQRKGKTSPQSIT